MEPCPLQRIGSNLRCSGRTLYSHAFLPGFIGATATNGGFITHSRQQWGDVSWQG